MTQHFAPQNPRSQLLRAHCQTSGVSLTAHDPYNNIVRTSMEALAATLGGTQSLHTNSFDEALGLPTEFSARIARNTQLILQNETGLTDVIDPLGGSYYVESLTQSLINESRKLINEVEQLGGMTRAVESGMPKLQIDDSAAKRQARIDRGEEVIVGVNRYQPAGEDEVDIRAVDNNEVRELQIKKLTQTRKTRDAKQCANALHALTETARAGMDNNAGRLLAAAIDCARARASVGEISGALEKVYRRYRAEIKSIGGVYGAMHHGDDKFAATAARVEKFAEQAGRRPRMLVVKLGQDGHDRGAKTIASAFADLGFDIDIGPLFQTPQEAARQAMENDAHIIGISSQAGGHRALVPDLMRALQDAECAEITVICGGVIPPDDYAALKRAGVAAIFGPGANIVDAANEVLGVLEGKVK